MLSLFCLQIQGQEQSRKLSALNYNNNYNEHVNLIQSSEFSTSIVDTRLSSTSIDSLCSLDSDALDKNNIDQCKILSTNRRLLMNYPESGECVVLASALH